MPEIVPERARTHTTAGSSGIPTSWGRAREPEVRQAHHVIRVEVREEHRIHVSERDVELRQALDRATPGIHENDEVPGAYQSTRPEVLDRRGGVPGSQEWLRTQLEGSGARKKCQMELAADVARIRFLARDGVDVVQPFTRVPSGKRSETAPAPSGRLELTAVKVADGWRFARIPEEDKIWFAARQIGGDVPAPAQVKNVPPVYPDIVKSARVQGDIVLACVISPEGKVVGVRTLRGIPLLTEAAIDAVRQWEYTPTVIDGQTVPVILSPVTVSFKLQ